MSKPRNVGNSLNGSFRTATIDIDNAGIDKSESVYRGRFAPSPTGPLHFGSLVTATASYLQALSKDGQWLLRIEDIDPPREMSGAADQIIETLRTHDFQWSGEIRYQSQNLDHFDAVVESLLARGLAFPCVCSRRQVRNAGRSGRLGPIYPGTCRERRPNGRNSTRTVRLGTDERGVIFDDRLYGRLSCSIANEIGDFVIRRADDLIAYTLAVVIDDDDQGVTEIVRGDDLLNFTPAQIYLQQVLGLDTPAYMHVPIALDVAGDKLSKQTGAIPVDNTKPAENLFRCLEFLCQAPPKTLLSASPADIWAWARTNWRPAQLAPRVKEPPHDIQPDSAK